MSKKRRNHSPEFKSKVALAAIKGDETLSQLASRFNINANLRGDPHQLDSKPSIISVFLSS